MNERDWHNAWAHSAASHELAEVARLQAVVAEQALTIAALKDTNAGLRAELAQAEVDLQHAADVRE